jgi:uncharacterized iron-regulated protein
MALLFLGKTRCSLCDEVITEALGTLSTTHFIESPSHPLWRYSDSTMHSRCFQAWSHREAFVSEYNRTIGRAVGGSGTRRAMGPDGNVRDVED